MLFTLIPTKGVCSLPISNIQLRSVSPPISNRTSPKTQRGVALIATLMVVIMVSVLGASVLGRSLTAKKNSNKLRDLEAACLAAESSLRAGERLVEAADGWAEIDYSPDANVTWYKDNTNWSATTQGVNVMGDFKKVSGTELLAGDPMVRIELIKRLDLMGPTGDLFFKDLFRVTAKGVGRTSSGSCLRQSVVQVVASAF